MVSVCWYNTWSGKWSWSSRIDNLCVFIISELGEVKMIWTLYKSELSAGNNGAKWSKWRQWLGQTPLARDGSRAETDTRREREGTFWMKTNVKTIKAIFPLINSPHWLLGLLSLRSHPVSKWMRTRCPSVIGFGLGGQEKAKIDAQWKEKKKKTSMN